MFKNDKQKWTLDKNNPLFVWDRQTNEWKNWKKLSIVLSIKKSNCWERGNEQRESGRRKKPEAIERGENFN